jgi:hypothetical protein
MPKIDTLDEAVIDSPPIVVYKAILNEIAGVTHWWMPYMEFKPKGDLPFREGAIVDLITHNKGTEKVSAKVTAKVTKLVEAKSIETEFVGDLAGTGTFTFEATDGKTKVQYRLNARLKKLPFVLLSPFVDLGKINSDTMQKGFKQLNSYLSKK